MILASMDVGLKAFVHVCKKAAFQSAAFWSWFSWGDVMCSPWSRMSYNVCDVYINMIKYSISLPFHQLLLFTRYICWYVPTTASILPCWTHSNNMTVFITACINHPTFLMLHIKLANVHIQLSCLHVLAWIPMLVMTKVSYVDCLTSGLDNMMMTDKSFLMKTLVCVFGMNHIQALVISFLYITHWFVKQTNFSLYRSIGLLIDWIHDHIKEGVRLRKLRTITSDNDGWRGRWIKMKDASQAWILVILTGTTVALVAWLVDVVQEWMSDLKTGYCTTNWRYNSKFCCWGRESGKIS